MTAKKVSAKASAKSIPSAENIYAEMWKTLGISNAPVRESNWGMDSKWPSVITDKGIEPANEVMKRHGCIVDGSPAFGGGYPGGTVNINQINNLAIDNVFLGWGELSLLQQNNIVNTVCTIFADSMTQKWIEVYSEDNSKKEKILQLNQGIQDFDLKEKMNEAIKRTILLGTMYVSPKLKGDEDDLEEPLLLSSAKIKKGDLENIYLIEPTWTTPIEFNMVNPRAPNFYKPQQYVVYGQTIHASRMKRMVYIEPVNLLAPMYLFGGIPFIQTLLPYILDFLNTKREIVRIVSRFNISILNTDLNALHGNNAYGKCTTLAGNAKGRAAAFNALRNNFGLYMLDKEEVFTQMQINVNGLTDILQQQAELLSLFTRITVSKLFGQAPRGMNATGEYDANSFNELIQSDQESKLRPVLAYCIDLIQLHLFGEIDKDIKFRFIPLGELNESAQSALKNDKVNRSTALVNAGMADPMKMMDVLVADPEMDYTNYDTTGDEELNMPEGPEEDNDQEE